MLKKKHSIKYRERRKNHIVPLIETLWLNCNWLPHISGPYSFASPDYSGFAKNIYFYCFYYSIFILYTCQPFMKFFLFISDKIEISGPFFAFPLKFCLDISFHLSYNFHILILNGSDEKSKFMGMSQRVLGW